MHPFRAFSRDAVASIRNQGRYRTFGLGKHPAVMRAAVNAVLPVAA